FGCGASGDAFKWLMETEGLKFPEAVERLAGEAGVSLPKPSADDEARESRRKTLYEVVETACAFFERQLLEPHGSAAREYLARREAEIHQHWRDGELLQRTAALQFPGSANRSIQKRPDPRGRRLYGRHRTGSRRFRGSRCASRHGAHR